MKMRLRLEVTINVNRVEESWCEETQTWEHEDHDVTGEETLRDGIIGEMNTELVDTFADYNQTDEQLKLERQIQEYADEVYKTTKWPA